MAEPYKLEEGSGQRIILALLGRGWREAKEEAGSQLGDSKQPSEKLFGLDQGVAEERDKKVEGNLNICWK